MTGPTPPPVPEELVEAWATAIQGACFVPLSRPERCELLRGLAAQLVAALHTEPFDPTAGNRVGAALVATGYRAPEVLARTVTVLSTRLAAGAVAPAGSRLSAVIEAVVAGFTRAARDETLGAQEEIRLAAAAASAEAERALRASEARFRYAALHDPLTRLPNHARLTELLQDQLTGPAPTDRLGVCCVDLDHFGAINDRLGPAVGDRLLVAVAGRLHQQATERGQVVARQHGDRFAIVVPDTTCPEDATKAADRALAALADPFQVDGHDLSISASAGVVERAAAGTSPAELIRAAEVALDWSKADGRGRWTLFEEQRNALDVARQRLCAALPDALRRDEFALAYQPLVDLRSRAVVGYEALARWHHPEHGPLGPDQFVGQAEATGLIVPLGLRLLEQACRQAAQWYADRGDRAPYVSVNVSARQLRQPGLVAEIVAVLDRTGLPARLLQLEITESAVVVPGSEAVDLLATLASLGVRIVIDDFGTGYANFAYLYDLPVHGIKLAGRLLRVVGGGDARRNQTGNAVLAALVSLGCTLGLTVTAEGVETAQQAELLSLLGCHVGQGWYYGHPEPGDFHR